MKNNNISDNPGRKMFQIASLIWLMVLTATAFAVIAVIALKCIDRDKR